MPSSGQNNPELFRQVGVLVNNQPRVSDFELNVLFAVLFKRRVFYLEFAHEMRADLFDSVTETHFQLLWDTIAELYAQAEHITVTSLYVVLSRKIAESPSQYEPWQALLLSEQGIVQPLYNMPVQDADVVTARAIGQRFLFERRITKPMASAFAQAAYGVMPAGVPDLLEQANREAAAIRSVGNLPLVSPATEFGGVLPSPVVVETTGLCFLDSVIRGQVRGTVNGIIGPIGGGKTTFAVHKIVASARAGYRQAMMTNTVPEVCVLITSEEPATMLAPRLQSAAFGISRARLEGLTDWNQLSEQVSGGYERQLSPTQMFGPYADNAMSTTGMSERDRYRVHYEWFTRCCQLLDFSGCPEYPMAGTGYVAEIEAALERITSTRQQPIREVVIDWAGALCERHIAATGKRSEMLRHLINNFADELKRRVAIRFNCTVWVMHQVKTSLADAPPTLLLSHKDAAESTGFAIHMTNCGCMGTTDRATGVRLLNFSKTRLVPVTAVHPIALRIHDELCELVDVTNDFVIDRRRRRIVRSDEAEQVHGFANE